MLEITRQEKIIYIRKAIDSGIVQTKICPEAKGEALRRLLKDSSRVTDKKLDQMYENAREYFGTGTEELGSNKVNIESQDVITKTIPLEILEIIKEQNKKIRDLENEITEIKAELLKSNSIVKEQASVSKRDTENVLGFSIRKMSSVNKKNGKRYMYSVYCALGMIGEKRVKIYIGKNLSKAKEKIQEYCKQHNIDL